MRKRLTKLQVQCIFSKFKKCRVPTSEFTVMRLPAKAAGHVVIIFEDSGLSVTRDIAGEVIKLIVDELNYTMKFNGMDVVLVLVVIL